MIFENKDFPAPSREEIKAALLVARTNPEDLDGRDLWILSELGGEDLE
ncbi:MAG: hypothetical protein JW772_02235 [Candidatus Diapherotrites archaeon]|nr:hypothetical protein [Candidatus Diapherotrites archaeon]